MSGNGEEKIRHKDSTRQKAVIRSECSFARSFAMPNAATFSIPPIGAFVQRYLANSLVSIDPFARNNSWATYTNDIDPNTSAQHHMDAAEFCLMMAEKGFSADLGIFDPPYSPRQISECYRIAGKPVTTTDTQNAALYKRVRDALDLLISPGGFVLSFGWHSNGMGKKRGYELLELSLVAHGGAHNDTICIAERKLRTNELKAVAETDAVVPLNDSLLNCISSDPKDFSNGK